MKNVWIFLAMMLGWTGTIYSQDKEGHHHHHLPNESSFEIGINAGVAMPLGDITEEYAFAGPGLELNANLDYNFRKWGIRAQAGYFELNTEERFEDFLGSQTYSLIANPWKANYYTLGPKLKWKGRRAALDVSLFGGLMNMTVPEIFQTNPLSFSPDSYTNFRQNKQALNNQILAGGSIGLSYKINDWFGIKASASYMTNRFAGNTGYTNELLIPRDINDDGAIDDMDLVELPLETQERQLSMDRLAIGIGIDIIIIQGHNPDEDDDVIVEGGSLMPKISNRSESERNSIWRDAYDTGAVVFFMGSGHVVKQGFLNQTKTIRARLYKGGVAEDNAVIMFNYNNQAYRDSLTIPSTSSSSHFTFTVVLPSRHYNKEDLVLLVSYEKPGVSIGQIPNLATLNTPNFSQRLQAIDEDHFHIRQVNLCVKRWRRWYRFR